MANSQSHNPYVGPRPFEREERNLFFGREREISELQSLLTAHRTLLLYAASGAGKTSLLNAGLLPLMEQEGFEVFPVARVRGLIPEGVRPQDISNLYVFNTLMSWTEDEASYKTLPRMSLAEFLNTREHILDSEGFSAPRLIIFDQFEELFTLYQQHWKQRADFFHQVAEALDQDPVLRVLFVMREDYLASFDPHVSLLPERLRARYRLDRLRFEDACQAVEGPLKGSGRSFADGVAARLVGELLKTKVESDTGEMVEAVGEYAEPVQLQIVCRNLWGSLPAEVTVITSGHLRSFGDVDDALTGFYEDAVHKTISETTATEEELRKWFARELITPAGTRGTVYRGKEDTAGIPNAAVDILENEHILRGEQRAGAHWYELTHDRLIEPIRNSNEILLLDYEVKQALLRARKRHLSIGMVVLILLFVLGYFLFGTPIKTITTESDSNGRISPKGPVTVTHGGSKTFMITPNLGYHISDVVVDGKSVGAVSSYGFNDVTDHHTISASFTVNSYTIKASSGPNGRISPPHPVKVDHGKSKTFTITPNPGYHIADVVVDGRSVGATFSYTLNDVTGDHAIRASFKPLEAFNPQGKNLQIPSANVHNPRNQITLEAWFNTNALGSRQAIITKLHPKFRSREPYYQYNLELRQTGQLYFALAINGVRRYIDGAFLVDPNKWYHVAATYDGKTMRLYLCGREWGKRYPKKGALSVYGEPLVIGGDNSDRPFKGRLAEVRIWNVARTREEIVAKMNETIPANERGLVWSSTN